MASLQKALAIRQRLADTNPASTQFQSELARSLNSIAIVESATGHSKEGLQKFEHARLIRQKLVDANPAVTEFQCDLATSHFNVGHLLRTTGQPKEALQAPRGIASDPSATGRR